MPDAPPADLELMHVSKEGLTPKRSQQACLVSRTLEHKWITDFAKQFGRRRVYLEAQFGKKEAAVMDFCKLQIAYYERHMSLGIVILLEDPGSFFGHRRASVAGMASFAPAKELLPIIGLECPICLIGISG